MSTDRSKPRRRQPPPGDRLLVVGVTGGLGAGKSTLVECLTKRGAVALSADQAGYEVLDEPGVRAELVQVFGAGILGENGRVDRARLGRAAFRSEKDLEQLNAISHPRLLERLRAQLREIAQSGTDGVVVLEAALLVEWDLGRWCDLVVCVTAPAAERVRRAAAARGWSLEEAKRRIDRQLPEEERVRYADRVLVNRGTHEEFRRSAEALAGELQELRRRRADASSPNP